MRGLIIRPVPIAASYGDIVGLKVSVGIVVTIGAKEAFAGKLTDALLKGPLVRTIRVVEFGLCCKALGLGG